MSAPYQCNVEIVNTTDHRFERSSFFPRHLWDGGHGEYISTPPRQIAPGQSVSFILRKYSPVDSPVGYGPEGGCTYTSAEGVKFSLNYRCPTLTSDGNSADAQILSGQLRITMVPNPVPGAGEPLNVQFDLRPWPPKG